MDYFVVLDAGHSKFVAGKRTPLFPDGTFMHEWEFNIAVVEKIFDKLKPYSQIDVFLANTEKYDVTLDNRCDRANRAWQAYQDKLGKENVKGVSISVHANAMKDYWNEIGNGTATFYYPNNAVDKAFAEVIQKNLIAKTKLKPHRGGVVAENFQMVRDVKLTACLVECAFMDNLEEAKLLRTDEFREACAEGIVNGLLEYFNIEKVNPIKEEVIEIPVKEKVTEVIYKKTPNNTFMLIGDVKDVKVKEVNKSNTKLDIVDGISSTFFWRLPDGKKYSTSILYADGITYQSYANHLPCSQSAFIINKDNTVEMKRIKTLGELNLSKVRVVIAGVGLINKLDSSFVYNPTSEGFKGTYADVLRKTNKTMMVYNKKEDKIYLVCRPAIYHKSALYYDLVELASDIGDVAVALDGSGSSCMYANGVNVFKGDGRVIHSVIYF